MSQRQWPPPPSFEFLPLEPTLRRVLLLAGVSVIGFGLYAARPIIVPTLLALCVMLAVQPIVDALERWQWPHAVAVGMGMLAALLGLGAFCAVILYGASELLTEIGTYEQAGRALQQDLSSWLVRKGLARLASVVAATRVSELFVTGLVSLARDVPTVAGHTLFVLLLSSFMLLERNTFRRKLLRRLSSFARSNESVLRDIQHYLAAKSAVSVLTGVTLGAWCWVWGVPSAALWGVTAFVLNYVPFIGSVMAAVPALALAVLTGDVQQAVLVASGYLFVNLVVGNLLEPRWLGRTCGLSPLVVVLSMVVWGSLLGPAGALLSVPLTSALRRALYEVKDFRWMGYLMANESVPESKPASGWPAGPPASTPGEPPLARPVPESGSHE